MRSENSGLIDLDALMKEAASSGELPPSPDDSLRAVSTPEPPPRPPSPPLAPPRAPARPAPRRKRSPAPFVALACAVAVGAIVAFVSRVPGAPPPAIAPAIATVVTPPIATPAIAEPKVEHGVSLADLPAPAPNATAIVPTATAATAAMATASAKLVAMPDAPPASSNDLGGAMRDAVGPLASANAVAPEEAPGGSARQLKPSPGAVIGAINAVLPAARACLDEDDPARNATITFESNGKVARVDLAGPTQSKDECIKTALGKARTMPFVEDSFAARATVRP